MLIKCQIEKGKHVDIPMEDKNCFKDGQAGSFV